MLFLIGGVTPRIKPLGKCRYACLACGITADLQISKNYSAFTFFFIPIIPFGVSYTADCPNCGSVMKLAKEKGRAFEQNRGGAISDSDLRTTQNNAAAHARASRAMSGADCMSAL